ncbi:hypothetical protein IV203_025834 [Nitzschia inconspicua]|uniref:DUF6818 domain-containing protein n=1 Tax=Nitzschia inconspicua TaxID=303405 RepID=A0A9K3K9M0_9STRA|nr:hypothetical protein IV203_020513 [Nitzschia inconspicua]KAG7339105.1 hypothetical protein IV203_017682 [Nitzschia inconspicua]KAG7344829.1 hypothetical protein IV203_032360 [Nitzschia inconspicua]KAG7352468.1 hypothetical protein IV203_008516 [Nitzschia inconspicua]KAG7362168.1 hypothetical protein IV203_025834 [Nitzschia inconspicua]
MDETASTSDPLVVRAEASASPAATPSPLARARGRERPGPGRGSSKSFTMQEKLFLLSNMQAIVPIDGYDWDTVLEMHNERYASCERDVNKLRRKFTSLYRTKIPSGDPHMPEDVRLAKYVRRLISEKNIVTAANEGMEEMNESDNDEGEAVTGEFARPDTSDMEEQRPTTGSNAEQGPTVVIASARRTPRRSTAAYNDLMQAYYSNLELDRRRYDEDRQRREEEEVRRREEDHRRCEEERQRREEERQRYEEERRRREEDRTDFREFLRSVGDLAKAYIQSKTNP